MLNTSSTIHHNWCRHGIKLLVELAELLPVGDYRYSIGIVEHLGGRLGVLGLRELLGHMLGSNGIVGDDIDIPCLRTSITGIAREF